MRRRFRHRERRERDRRGTGCRPTMRRRLLEAGADVRDAGRPCLRPEGHAGPSSTSEPRILRPLNYRQGRAGAAARASSTCRAGGAWSGRAGAGAGVHEAALRRSVFGRSTRCCAPIPAAGRCRRRVIDFHAEATSEKMAMGHFCDGRASACRAPTPMCRPRMRKMLPGGTGYLTDAGMCGDYDSVIGMEKAEPMRRFVTGMPKDPLHPRAGPVTLSGVLVETDDATGRRHRAFRCCATGACCNSRARDRPAAGLFVRCRACPASVRAGASPSPWARSRFPTGLRCVRAHLLAIGDFGTALLGGIVALPGATACR
jgi:calcineurin-like phosphoesterase